ncbi:hypothetical protein PIB30_082370, partial [Stylosanthes scabra]|nr:hypothetical protein [Stylosanthes scabra]
MRLLPGNTGRIREGRYRRITREITSGFTPLYFGTKMLPGDFVFDGNSTGNWGGNSRKMVKKLSAEIFNSNSPDDGKTLKLVNEFREALSHSSLILEETLIHHAAKRTSHLRHPSSEPTPPPRSVTPTPSEPPKRSCPHLRRRQPFDKGALGNGGFHPAATATTRLSVSRTRSFLPAGAASKHVSSGLQRRLSLQPPRPPISSHRRRHLAETAALRLAKIVGSAPGFPHGIIDPIE